MASTLPSIASPRLSPAVTPSRTVGAQPAVAVAPEKAGTSDSGAPSRSAATQATADNQRLEEGELSELRALKARDREVRAHEAAHQSVGGQHAGSASFTYSRGPDGVQYAVGGEVPIDIGTEADNPQATLEKMRVVRAAALAPAQPSSQDRQVAAQAMQQMLQAQVELAARQRDSITDAEKGSASERDKSEAGAAYQRVDALEPGNDTSSRAARTGAGSLNATA